MEILKANRDKVGKSKHVGGEIPPVLHSYLCLYSAAKGVGKSETIREGLELWKTQSESEEKLTRILVTHIQNSWSIFKSQKMKFKKFLKTVEKELKCKGLGLLEIEKIVGQIKE